MKSTMAERLESLGRTIHSFFYGHDQYLLACTVLLLWCFIFQEYFLFGKLFLFEQISRDTLVQCYPIEYFRISNIKNLVFPFWSFQFGFGKNIYHEMINISPFDIIFLFFQGKVIQRQFLQYFFYNSLLPLSYFKHFLKKLVYRHSSPLLVRFYMLLAAIWC